MTSLVGREGLGVRRKAHKNSCSHPSRFTPHASRFDVRPAQFLEFHVPYHGRHGAVYMFTGSARLFTPAQARRLSKG